MPSTNSSIELLDWDTDFFGFKVGRVNSGTGTINWDELFDGLSREEIKLAYFYSSEAINKTGINENLFEIALADKKVTYLKKINSNCKYPLLYNNLPGRIPRNKIAGTCG